MLKDKKVVIIADWLTNQGGAEQVIVALAEMFPKALIYTSVYSSGAIPALKKYEDRIRTTWLQKLPFIFRKKHQFLLPFFPGAFAALDLSEADIIISSSSAFAKCVKKSRDNQIHICYCHSPTRYLYHARDEYIDSYPLPWWAKPAKWVLPFILNFVTPKDLAAAKAIDYFISNSDFIGQRIKKYYDRESTTIYPCTDIEKFLKSKPPREKTYFLALGRFIPYKKFDLLIETFKKNGLPLKLAGIGPELKRCKALAEGVDNIEFLGFVADKELPDLYAGARGFVFPAEEDFGLTPVEAMAAGVPVIGYGKGGVTESVTSDTGLFFTSQTPKSLQKALDKFIKIEQKFSSKKIKRRAEKFSVKNFQTNLIQFLEKHI